MIKVERPSQRKESPSHSCAGWPASEAEVMALGNLPGPRAVPQPTGSVTAFCLQIKGKSRGRPLLPKLLRLR